MYKVLITGQIKSDSNESIPTSQYDYTINKSSLEKKLKRKKAKGCLGYTIVDTATDNAEEKILDSIHGKEEGDNKTVVSIIDCSPTRLLYGKVHHSLDGSRIPLYTSVSTFVHDEENKKYRESGSPVVGPLRSKQLVPNNAVQAQDIAGLLRDKCLREGGTIDIAVVSDGSRNHGTQMKNYIEHFAKNEMRLKGIETAEVEGEDGTRPRTGSDYMNTRLGVTSARKGLGEGPFDILVFCGYGETLKECLRSWNVECNTLVLTDGCATKITHNEDFRKQRHTHDCGIPDSESINEILQIAFRDSTTKIISKTFDEISKSIEEPRKKLSSINIEVDYKFFVCKGGK